MTYTKIEKSSKFISGVRNQDSGYFSERKKEEGMRDDL